MTRSEYAKRAADLFDNGKISEETYDAMLMNIDEFCDPDIWVATDVDGNTYEFDTEADAYMFCYDYIEKALCDDHDEFHAAIFELDEYGEANDLIGYKLKGEEEDAE